MSIRVVFRFPSDLSLVLQGTVEEEIIQEPEQKVEV